MSCLYTNVPQNINASSKYLHNRCPPLIFCSLLSQFVPEKNVINSTKLLKVDNQSEVPALCPDKTIEVSALTLKFKIVFVPWIMKYFVWPGPESDGS